VSQVLVQVQLVVKLVNVGARKQYSVFNDFLNSDVEERTASGKLF